MNPELLQVMAYHINVERMNYRYLAIYRLLKDKNITSKLIKVSLNNFVNTDTMFNPIERCCEYTFSIWTENGWKEFMIFDRNHINSIIDKSITEEQAKKQIMMDIETHLNYINEILV